MLFKTVLGNKLFLLAHARKISTTKIVCDQTKNPIVKKVARPLLSPHYGGRDFVTLLPGSGIGPELLEYVIDIFTYCHVPVDFEVIVVKNTEDLKYAVTSILRNGVAIKGNMRNKDMDHEEIPPNVYLRESLDLYVNLLHCKSIPHVPCKQKNVDCVLIRQNTEGEYSMLEHESVPGIVESLKVITRENTERLTHWACEYALKHNRKTITIIHKANIMKLSDGLFRHTAYEVGKKYPKLQFNDMIVDAFTSKAVIDANQFDVLLMPNLYGAVAVNIMCGLLGGPGLTAGRNYGDRCAVFELGTRNTGSHIAGKDIANPISMLMAAVELLYYLHHDRHAELINTAILKTLEDKEFHTTDLGGNAKSSDVVDRVLGHIETIQKTNAIMF